jgi:hypothetical protein
MSDTVLRNVERVEDVSKLSSEGFGARPNLAESTSTWKRHLASVSDVLAAPVTVRLAETGPGGDVGIRASSKAGEVGHPARETRKRLPRSVAENPAAKLGNQ